MKISFLPKTKLSKFSVIFIVLMPIFFCIGSSFTDSLYKDISSGKTILEDITVRPALALTMLFGMISGIMAFALGIIAILKNKEKALFVFLSTLIGALLILFLIGEIIFPH